MAKPTAAKTYLCLTSISTPTAEFEEGDEVTAADIPAKSLAWLVECAHLVDMELLRKDQEAEEAPESAEEADAAAIANAGGE